MRRCRIESLGVSPPRRTLLRWGSIKHAVVAGRRCLKASRYHPADVRVLVNSGVHRDGHTCEPAMAAYVQHGLGINPEFQGRRTLAFDLLNGGCGMLNAIHVASAMIEAGDVQVAMVVSSEANCDSSPDPSWRWPPSGAAVVLDAAPRRGVGFGEFVFHTDESCAELYTSVVSLAQARGKLRVQRAAELEGAWLARAGGVVDELLAKENLRKDEIDLVVPAQISAGFLARLPEAIGFAREKVADYSGELADTLSTSVLLALQKAQENKSLGAGKRALLLAFGSGITVAAASHRFG